MCDTGLEGMQTTVDAKPLSTLEHAYLRKVAKARNGVNDWQAGWRKETSVRQSLRSRKLVRVDSYRACGMGDVDSTVCTITPEGRKVLFPRP